MSVRNQFVLLLALASLAFLAACGNSNGGLTTGTAPPSGAFSNSNLNGTYIFSVSGIDLINGAPFAMVGAFTANGGTNGGISSGGTIDINDEAYNPVPGASISGGTYHVGQDGRGTVTLSVPSNPTGGQIELDFALQDSFHGVISNFDGNYTGSGTLDQQTSGAALGTTPYAFSLSGFTDAAGTPQLFAAVGNFTIGTGGAISGLADFNDGEFADPDQAISGTVVAGPSSTPGTTIVSAPFGTQAFNVYVIDSTHLKFVETDAGISLVGDAYPQTDTSIVAETFAFTLEGSYPGGSSASAAGGFLITDGAGGIETTSNADFNNAGDVGSQVAFSGTYSAAGTGRYTLSLASFSDGSLYAAYPSSGGLLILEIDDAGIMTGAGYTQSNTTFSASQGYALNLQGVNIADGGPEVDDVAEFSASTSGLTCDGTSISSDSIDGVIDENSQATGPTSQGVCGQYTPGSGRTSIVASANTLNGGFAVNAYSVDGTLYPFIETDSNQVAAGVMILQNAAAATQSLARSPAMFVPHALLPARALEARRFSRK